MFDPHPDLTLSVIRNLGWLYLILFAMNIFWTLRSVRLGGHVRLPKLFGGQSIPGATGWAAYSAVLLMVAIAHLYVGQSDPESFVIRLPLFVKNIFDLLADPVSYFTILLLLFVFLIVARSWLVRPTVSWLLLNGVLLFMALAMTDWDFRQIVGKPDNVPIVAMLFIVGFFTWLYFSRAVENDHRLALGKPLLEQEHSEKVLVWPDLVYTELICMVVLTVLLIVWGVVVQAPLEEPASAASTPNPSKAPWYFLGLQEMLVYYDPWLAGVVFPSLIVVGLMALPYIDFNKKGNGYYTFSERKFAVTTFMVGFMPLWIAMIILGTFLRGPNWNIFGIFEYWDVHKLLVLNNINLSEWFWLKMMHTGLPTPASDASALSQVGTIVLRELPGIVVVFLYLMVLPPLMAATVFRTFFQRMGFVRYMVFSQLLLLMAALPLKMVLRWAFNLKYIIAIPEYFLNV